MSHPTLPQPAASPYDPRDEAVQLVRPTPMRRPSHVTRPMRPARGGAR